MRNIKAIVIGGLFTMFAISNNTYSQDSLSFDLSYEVNRVYPSLSHTKSALSEANTIADLNKYYKPEWVREFITIDISTSHNGEIMHAVSQNDTLTHEQKLNIKKADVNSEVLVYIKYIPENTLVDNDAKELDFSFFIDPDQEAQFATGQQQLKRYIEDNAMSKVSEESFNIHHLTAVKFTISEEGQVVDAYVFESSEDEEVDAILLEAICNMPKWTPAEYKNGLTVKQDFVLTIGDHRSCVINLLNVRREG